MPTKYFTGGPNTMTNFDLSFATVNVVGGNVTYRGSSGAERVFVGSGLTFDFTQSLSGPDKVYLNGAFADFALTVAGSQLRLTRAADSTVVILNGADALETVVFLDGSVSNVALRQYALGNTGAPTPSGEVSATNGYAINPGYVTAPPQVRAFASGSDSVFGTVPSGASLVVRGSGNIETLYIKAGSTVDATQLLGGLDKVYFTGALADYTLSATGSILNLSRTIDGATENVRVAGGDQLTFADGAVTSTALLNAVRNSTAMPVPAGAGTPGVPVVQTVAITSDAGADNTYKAGDVVRVNVTFSDVVHVTGTPQMQVNVGGTLRTATFVAGNNTDTLSFDYTIASGDSDTNGLSIDMAALQLNGATIRTVAGERALTLTPVLADQGTQLVDGIIPADPVINTVAGNDSIATGERATAVVSGTAEANANVDISFSSGFTRTVQADGSGNYSYSLTTADYTAMGVGAETISVVARDAAGNASTGSVQRSIVVETAALPSAINLSAIAAGTGGFVINGQAVSDNSGWSVASAGDVNGDGLADLIVGAYFSDPASGTDAGRSYVVFGKAGTTAIDLAAVAAGTGGFVINGQAAADNSGLSVASAGDVNGDGLADLIVGAQQSDPAAGANAGRSYVVFGKADTTAINLSAVAAGTGGFVINGQATEDLSGFSVASAGDVNGDGLADLIVGANFSDPAAGSDAGRSYVVFGKANTTAIDLSAVAAGTGGFVINGQAANDNSGRSVASAGDVNGDGLADLLVGAYSANGQAGRSYVVFGKADNTAINLSAVAAGTGGFVINGLTAGDYLGWSVASAGDTNGDGLVDLIVGAPNSNPASGTGAGRSYVVFGKANTTAIDLAAVAAGTGGFVINGQAAVDESGISVASAGDVNGDGLADLIVGARYSDPASGANAGRSYVVYGKANTTAIDLAAVAAGNGGFVINGEAVNDNSGHSVASAGDVDGDGLSDLIVGAPNSDPAAGINAGRSYVILSSQIGLGNFGAELTQVGTSGADTLTGTSGANRIAAGAGNDTITGAGGADVIYGGAGNDTIVLNASNIANLAASRIDGGTGRDTIVLGSDVTGTVDLRGLNAQALQGIEALDITGGGNVTFRMDAKELMQLEGQGAHNAWNTANWGTTVTGNTAAINNTGYQQVRISGNTGDVFQIASSNLVLVGGGTVGAGGRTYNVYNDTAHKLQLIVDSEVVVNQNNAAINLAAIAAGTGGFVINGQAAGDESGFSVASAGDVNGDGLADLIVGARTSDPAAGLNAGRSYVVFGKANTTAIDLAAVAAGTGGFVINGQAVNDWSGYSVASAGDVNGDGLADVIVGAPYSSPAAGSSAGRSYVVFGKADTTAVNLSAVASGTGGFVINGQAAQDWSAYSVASAGDVNGDGLADLIVGAHYSDPAAGSDAGRSYVVFGKANTAAIDLSAVAAGTGGFVINGQAADDQSGYSVASAGDVNGDGLADLIVGAKNSDPATGGEAGRSYVVFGKADTAAVNLSAVAAGTGGFVINGQAASDQSGISVASAGDVNGDGLADLIVGAVYSDPAAGTDAGRSYVVFGKADTTAINLSAVAAGTGGFVINGQAAGDASGLSVASAGDINGDGLADLIVGAYGSDPASGPDAGRSYVVYGKASTTAIDLSAVAAGNGGFVINGQAANDQSGRTVASAGDVDGDGLSDLIVGAFQSDPAAGTNAGRSYVILSSQIGLGNFGAELTQVGTSGADTLTGTSGANRIAAGAGNDTITGAGGADVIYGGAGNDTIVLNASNIANLAASRIDGGTGRDTIVLGSDVTGTVDLRGLNAQALKGIEALDITGGGNVTFRMDAKELLQLEGQGAHNAWNAANWGTTVTGNTAAINNTGYQQVRISGNTGDVFRIDSGDLVLAGGGTVSAGGRSYIVYNDAAHKLQLIVDSEVVVNQNNAAINLSAIAAGTGGFVINGQAAGDQSGWSVASAGDVNGDGLADLIVGARYSDPAAGADAGRSYVVFGKAGTTAIDLSAVAAGTGGFVINGQAANDLSGSSVASAGDVNGDGLADLIVGAATSSPATGSGAGRSYVVFGKADTTAVNLSAVASGTGGFVINGQAATDYSGLSVASAGDVNGDGLADLIVSAPFSDPAAGVNAGRSYVVFGKAGTTAVDLAAVATGTGGFVINGQAADDYSGNCVASAGDVNGDGLADLIVSAPFSDPAAGVNAGRSYVVFGKADTTAINLSAVAAGIGGFVVNGRELDEISGYSLASAGDVNGDGLADLIVGASQSDPATGVNAGRAYVVYGKASTTAVDLSAVAAGSGGFAINGQAAGDLSSNSVASAGDVDGDGLSDLIVGAYSSDPASGIDAGRSYVILSSQIGLGNFGAELTQVGTSGVDTLTGTSAANRIAAGAGNDTITGAGGADVIYGGAGNDTIVLNASNIANIAASRIDGGTGLDTVVLGSDVTGVVNLRGLNAQALQGIEALDITGGGNVTFRMDAKEFMQLEGQGAHNAWNAANWGTTVTGNTAAINNTGYQQVRISGNTGDVFSIPAGGNLVLVGGGTVSAGGRSYQVYNDAAHKLQLIVDSEVVVQQNNAAINLSAIAAGTGGFVINGQAAGEQSGISVASAGDVNGDGLADLIVGAWFSDPATGADAGRSYVVFGKANTTAIDLAAVATGTGGFVINGEAANDYSGYSVASAGDVNGDGLADLIVGAFNNGGVNTGRSYVVFGKANTTAVDLSAVAAGTGGFAINSQAASDINGYSVASAGDVNGDGLSDLIVGAYASDPAAGLNSGRSYVVFGKADGTAINLATVAGGTGGFVINGQAAGDFSGQSVASAGDVNGDGLADLIVGANRSDPAAGTDAGRSYVVFGKADTTAINLSAVAAGTGGFVINGQAADDYSGGSVASAGDVNGDGLADLIVGASSSDPAAGASAGRSYVVFGKADTTAINLSAVAAGTGGFVINGQTAGDSSGYSVSSAGDVNGDGLADLIVSSHASDAAGVDAGRAYVVYGKASTTAVDLAAVAAGNGGFVINGQAAGDYSGRSVASAGDVDGDGLSDLIVGADNADPAAGSNAGRSYVILSSQIGLGNFGAELTQMGTSGVDTLTGTSGANRMAAGAGNDMLIGGGGIDVIYGGAGNDTIVLNASNIANLAASRIDGGLGRDTVLMASDVTGVLDLRGLNGQALKGIEMLDFDNGAANTLQFNNANLRSLHDEAGKASGVENRVMVGGEASDAVQLYTSGTGTWSTSGTQVDSGTTYNVYAHSSNSFDRLWIEQGVAVAVL